MRRLLVVVALGCLISIPSDLRAQFNFILDPDTTPEKHLEAYRRVFDAWVANVSFRAKFGVSEKQYDNFANARDDVDGKPVIGTPVLGGLLAKRGSSTRVSVNYKGGPVEVGRNALKNFASDTIRNDRLAAQYIPPHGTNFGGYVAIERVPDSFIAEQIQIPTPLTTGFLPVNDLLKDKFSDDVGKQASEVKFVISRLPRHTTGYGFDFHFGERLIRRTLFEAGKTGPRLVCAELVIREPGQEQQIVCQFSSFFPLKNGDVPRHCRVFAGWPRTSNPVVVRSWTTMVPTEPSDDDFQLSLPADTRVIGLKVPPKPVDGRLVIDLDKIALEDLLEPAVRAEGQE